MYYFGDFKVIREMKLEELIKESERKELENLTVALEIAEREWNNIRVSLELCGDIGKFDKEDFMIGIIDEDIIVREPIESPTKSVSFYSPTFYPMYFVKNLLVMESKFEDHGYMTIEALNAFIELATKAVSRLGLEGNFAMGFGSGYAYVRTGWIAEKGWATEREIFHKKFFEGRKTDYKWEFYWDSVKERFLLNYNKFIEWKENPAIYEKETKPGVRVKPLMV